MGVLRYIYESILMSLVVYAFTAFIIFTSVVSVIGGVCDVVYAGRADEDEARWTREAMEDGELYEPVSHAANRLIGIAQFLLFACVVSLGVMILRRRAGRLAFGLLLLATMICLLVVAVPRPATGTASGHMREAYSFLSFLGILDIAAFRGLRSSS
ncbi:hypothetical protein JW921_07920 [Candidatus Fermentibacterales bacterium]|nr:hypothetical protein [Candidatus Fermentibacterales bacterium]